MTVKGEAQKAVWQVMGIMDPRDWVDQDHRIDDLDDTIYAASLGKSNYTKLVFCRLSRR